MGCIKSRPIGENANGFLSDGGPDGWSDGALSSSQWGRQQITTEAPKLVVVDVGGGSINIYLNNKKKAAPSYPDQEYESWKGGDATPMSELIKLHVAKVLLDDSSRHAIIKIGITGSARKDLTTDEMKDRVENLRAELEADPPLLCDTGVLPRNMEGLLEQECILNILDRLYAKSVNTSPNTFNRKTWFVFNMGGSDCRMFSRYFKTEFPQKGATFASHLEYHTGNLDPALFRDLVTKKIEQTYLKAKEVEVGNTMQSYMVITGFFGYIFSMIFFAAMWDDVRQGNPIEVKTVKDKLQLGIEHLQRMKAVLAEDGQLTKDDLQQIEWNNKKRGSTRELVLQQLHLMQLLVNFLDSATDAISAKAEASVCGVIIDNKIGKHVQKNPSSHYKKMFNELSDVPYDGLVMATTFGQKEMFSWAIGLGNDKYCLNSSSLEWEETEELAALEANDSAYPPLPPDSEAHLADSPAYVKAKRGRSTGSIVRTLLRDSEGNSRNFKWWIEMDQLALEERIGQGAAGSVYKGTVSGRRCAIKELHANVIAEELAEFQMEMDILVKLSHPCVLRFFGVSSDQRHVYMCMEYMPQVLSHVLATAQAEHRSLEHAHLQTMARNLASGIGYLHAMNVIHRDLKPDNILLDHDNSLRICDFGMSRFQTDTDSTMTGAVGTPGFMPPEVMMNCWVQYDGSAWDCYSFGMILYNMWTLKPPFEGMGAMQIIIEVATNDRRPDLLADTPPVLADLIRRCWAKDPLRRPRFEEIRGIVDRRDFLTVDQC